MYRVYTPFKKKKFGNRWWYDVLGLPKQSTISALEFLGFKCGFSVESQCGGVTWCLF